MSILLELAGFALLDLAAYHSFGTGAAELVGGVAFLVLHVETEGVKLDLRDKLFQFVARRRKSAEPTEQ